MLSEYAGFTLVYVAMVGFTLTFGGLLALNIWLTYLRWNGRYVEANDLCYRLERYLKYLRL